MERKNIIWDEKKSNRLYDFIADNPPAQSSYFGYQVGRGILNFCKYFVSDIYEKKCLDYGCGCGHIIEYFLKDGINMYGVDMSPESVSTVNEKFAKYANWEGAFVFDGNRLPYTDDEFDVIICTEVIEHILQKDMELFLTELRRILKSDGILLVTTPNNEDFSKNLVCCPECNTVFHKHGHCNKFDNKSLMEIMENYHYKTIMCEATDFYLFQEEEIKITIWNLSLGILLEKYRRKAIEKKDKASQRMIDRIEFKNKINQKYCPNLFWVGTK